MTRKDEIINYSNSFKGKGMENEELKEIIRLAIIDGALWADDNPKWKPSDEQMKILQYLCNTSSHPNEKVIPILESLYNDLKKLKGE